MQFEWIIDVMADLRSFAQKNGLPDLDAHLAEGVEIVTAELLRREAAADATDVASDTPVYKV